MLSEMMNRSFNQQYSIYAQDNLFSSMQLLNEFDQNYITPAIKQKSGVKRPKYELATELIEWMAERPAFLYPEILPVSALKPRFVSFINHPYKFVQFYEPKNVIFLFSK